MAKDLSGILQQLKSEGFEFRTKGFFNVEGGEAAVATRYLEWCDEHSLDAGPMSSECDSCHRGPRTCQKVPAGDGDGVYVVFELFHGRKPTQSLGAITIFDSSYGIAQQIRLKVEQEVFPQFPEEAVQQFSQAKPILLGELEATSAIYFSDAGAGLDSKHATVDVQLAGGAELTVFSFLEPAPTDKDEVIRNFAQAWGKDEASVARAVERSLAGSEFLAKELGRDLTESFPAFHFRALLVLDSEIATKIQLEPQELIEDWELFAIQLAGTVVSSHQRPMHESTVWVNALLAREADRVAGDVSEEEAKRLLFDVWTWAYQGLLAGDQDCRELLKNSYQATNEEIYELLRRRGQYQLAEELLRTGSLPGLETKTEPLATQKPPSSFTKSNPGGLSGSSDASLLQQEESSLSQTQANSDGYAGKTNAARNFCGNCGAKFERAEDKFCSECGEMR